MTAPQPDQKTLVWIFGPPAVGKMTVGLELSRITGLPLFHNHLSIEAVLPVFPYGTPPFNRLVARFRDHMFQEAAASELPGLIFTMMWAFDLPSDLRFVEKQKAVFENEGGRVVFVELRASLETRIARNEWQLRLSAKPSKRDVAASRERLVAADSGYRLLSAIGRSTVAGGPSAKGPGPQDLSCPLSHPTRTLIP